MGTVSSLFCDWIHLWDLEALTACSEQLKCVSFYVLVSIVQGSNGSLVIVKEKQ